MNISKKTSKKPPSKLPLRGIQLLYHPTYNKGTAFTPAERDKLSLRGLLPPRVQTAQEQMLRVMDNFRLQPNDLARYIYLIALQDRNETLFYRTILDNLEMMMPIIYTPTVGQACQLYGHIFRRPRGLFISLRDRGKIASILKNWPQKDVRVIVVTDGERILGLGDLGAHGMGIPVGKLSLYTACAGIHPSKCLPITLDVGTNNEMLLREPLYIGLVQKRLRGAAYDSFVDEFATAVQKTFPKAILQLEDFGNLNAFRLLDNLRHKTCCFDDDIQGTASVALSGLLTALRLNGGKLRDQKLLFLGAGEAGIGIGDLATYALRQEGLTETEARQRCWFVDSKGLVVKSRADLNEHKQTYAHEHPPAPDFQAAVEALRPTAIIGVSGRPRMFTQPIIEAMARFNRRPIVFALSNPTSKAECTAEEAYRWTNGQAIYASGSPFDPVHCNGKTLVPGQGNNAYIFPGVGLGVMAAESRLVTDEMFYLAAKALDEKVTDYDLSLERIYPALNRMREVSLHIALAVAQEAYRQKLARKRRPANLKSYIKSLMYNPEYPLYA